MNEPMVWAYNGHNVFFDPGTEMGSLTAMWEACGRPETKAPKFWTQGAQAAEVVAALAEKLNVRNSYLLETRQGRNGGTWAHWQIATVYAHYLDPKFYLWWNEQARAHISGQAVPVEFGSLLAQIVELGYRLKHVGEDTIKHAQALGRTLQDGKETLGAIHQMLPSVQNQQIADPGMLGYIYVLYVVGSDPKQYKIGKTHREPETRKRELSGPINTRLDDIAVITTDDPDLLEKRLKGFYKKKKVKGTREVFYLSALDIERIQALSEFITAGLFDPSVLEVYKQQPLL